VGSDFSNDFWPVAEWLTTKAVGHSEGDSPQPFCYHVLMGLGVIKVAGLIADELWASKRSANLSATGRRLAPAPLARYVNQPWTEAELAAIRRTVMQGQPFRGDHWARASAQRLGLESTFRPGGRSRKDPPC
jgi:hypothetical protein